MSEQINKVLASTSQSFTTAEQEQARNNIGAAAASAVGLSGVSHDANLTGDGSTGSPLGLSSTIKLENSLSATKMGPAYVSAANHVGTAYMGPNEVYVNTKLYHESAQLLGGRLTFWDTATSEKVDISSIQRWNSMTPWAESGNSLGTGYGGYRVSAASQYNYGNAYTNWACREVECDGAPNQQLYGFQVPPSTGSATYLVNGDGHFVKNQPTYECHVFNISGDDNVTDWLYPSAYPSGLSTDMRLDFVVYGTGNGYVLINMDLRGTTADLHTGESAAMFYNASADEWTTFVGNLP